MLKKTILLIPFLFSFFLNVNAQKATLQEGLSLKYLVQEPAEKSTHPPVIILLHGYGSNEADLFELKGDLPKNFLIISARAPLKIGDNAFQWYQSEKVNGASDGNATDLKNSTAAIRKFISEIVKKYDADPASVYLSGFSQGAIMSYEVGLTSPQLLKGIAPLSGKIMPSLMAQVKSTPALKKLNIFIGHGDADDRIYYREAVASNKFLQGLGLTPAFHTYKGVRHSIDQQEMIDLVKWLTAF